MLLTIHCHHLPFSSSMSFKNMLFPRRSLFISSVMIVYVHLYLVLYTHLSSDAFALTTSGPMSSSNSDSQNSRHSNDNGLTTYQPSSFEEQRAAVFRKINERILNAPIGSLTKGMVAEAKYCMEANIDLSIYRSYPFQQYDPRNVELLLKRIVDEKSAKGGADVVGTIGTDWYNCVMRAWMTSIRPIPMNENEVIQNAQAEQRIFEILHYIVSDYLEAHSLQEYDDDDMKYLTNIKPDLYTFCLAYSSLPGDKHKEERNNYIIPSLKMVLFDEDLNGDSHELQKLSKQFADVLGTYNMNGVDPVFMNRILYLMDDLDQGLITSECIELILKALEVKGPRVGKTRGKIYFKIIEHLLERLDCCELDVVTSYETMMNLVNLYDNGGIIDTNLCADVADQILKSMKKKGFGLSQKIISDILCIWSRIGNVEGYERVEALLKTIDNSSGIHPDLRAYNSILKMYSIAYLPQKAEDLLLTMVESFFDGTSPIKPDAATFTIAINAWANSSVGEEAWTHAQQLFEKMISLKLSPSSITFTAMLYCLARNDSNCSVAKASSMLFEMKNDYKLKINTQVMNAYIHALANSNDSSAAQLAEEALREMEEKHDAGEDDIAPGVITYTCVISAFAKSNLENAGLRAENVLFRMEKLAEKNKEATPNSRSYNAALAAWAKCRMKGSAARAQTLLERMESLYRDGNQNLKPDVYSYTTVIHAWARSFETKNSAQRATRLLSKMEKLAESDPDLNPNMHTYTSVINAWAKSRDPSAPERAQQIIDKMENSNSTKPNVNFYTAAIDCYAKTRRPDAARKADAMLKRMEKRYEEGDVTVKPNVRAFNAVINAWSWSNDKNAAVRCEEILQQMEERSESGDLTVKPNTITFSTVMCVYARSSQERKAFRCWQLLRRMDKLYKNGYTDAKPNVLSYTTVINACAKTRGLQSERDEALKIAYDTFKELESSDYDKPNFITFSVFMKACYHLLPKCDMRNNLIEIIFSKACVAGQVEQSVLRQFYFSNTDAFHKLIFNQSTPKFSAKYLSEVSARDIMKRLPPKWTRNAVKSTQKGMISEFL